MKKNNLVLNLLFSILLLSCSTENSTNSNTIIQQQKWNVSYLQSGGIAGLMDSIKIDHIGRLSSFDEKLNKITIKQVSKDDITQLYQMLLAIEENNNSTITNTPNTTDTSLNPNSNLSQRQDSLRSPCFDCITSSLNVEFLTHRYKVNLGMKHSTHNQYGKIADKILEINNKLHQQN